MVTPPLQVKHVRREYRTEHGGTDALTLRLLKRKNDQLGTEKSEVSMGRTGLRDCPVDAFDFWIRTRLEMGEDLMDGEALLFPVWDDELQDYVPLTYEMVMAALDEDMRAEGLDTTGYTGYSFRIGAATQMALNGVPDFWIRELGGWGNTSQAYLTYLRLTLWEKRADMTVF